MTTPAASPVIGLIVTGDDAMKDFKVFVKTLDTWHPDATLYVLTDSKTKVDSFEHKCKLITKSTLDAYSGKNRKAMEKLPGKVYDTLFKDFTYEKSNVLKWIFEAQPTTTGVWFMDADIVHLAPLPEIPQGKTLALCPHYIRERDQGLFGKYNAGMFWLKDKSLLDIWREAGKTSRFFEQASLEVIALKAKDTLHEFPIQVNFGWWRMFQSDEDKKEIQNKFSLFRADLSVGVRYDGKPLQSIHTHSFDRTPGDCGYFNTWFALWLNKFVASHPPLANWKQTVFS